MHQLAKVILLNIIRKDRWKYSVPGFLIGFVLAFVLSFVLVHNIIIPVEFWPRWIARGDVDNMQAYFDGKQQPEEQQKLPLPVEDDGTTADPAITYPPNGSAVGYRPIIEGTVSDLTASVWVIVHPMGVGGYWVQPRVTVRENGIWKVNIYIGRSGSIDVGKRFEVRAFVNPIVELREGNELNGWPRAAAMSNIHEFVRN